MVWIFHSLQSVHVCCSFYYCLHFIHEWGKEIAFPFACTYFFYRHPSILFFLKFASSPPHPISFALFRLPLLYICINNRISIKISNLFPSKSEKNFVRHFDFCMTQKIKIYNQIPYIRWLFLSLILPFRFAFIVIIVVVFILTSCWRCHFCICWLAHSVDKWRHIHSSRAHWEYDRKMAQNSSISNYIFKLVSVLNKISMEKNCAT